MKLATPDPNWSTQTTILLQQKQYFIAYSLCYDLNVSFVICFIGHNYTCTYHNIHEIASCIQHIIPQEILHGFIATDIRMSLLL